MTYRMTLEDAQSIADAIANTQQGVSRGDAVIDAVEAIVAREVAAAEADRDYWKRQAKGFLHAATEDLGRYHREKDRAEAAEAKVAAVEALADEWWNRATEATSEPLSWRRVTRDLRAALGEARP